MAKRYFRKELVSNAVFVDGKPVKWELVGNNRGALILDDEDQENQSTIKALEGFSAARKMGVAALTADQYEDWKKKALSEPSKAHRPDNLLRVFQSPSMHRRPKPYSPFGAPEPDAPVARPAAEGVVASKPSPAPEPAPVAGNESPSTESALTQFAPATTKRRGRPPKSKPAEAAET